MTMQANRAGVAKLWLLNFVGNAAALAAWYFWLLVPDAHGWQVAFALLAAICIIALVVWLRAGTFAYFRLAEFRDTARSGARSVVRCATSSHWHCGPSCWRLRCGFCSGCAGIRRSSGFGSGRSCRSRCALPARVNLCKALIGCYGC